ncbi:MAG: PilZ domain-containing protein [Planctomycetes bacterium]|nr:PilZ domain-containing protein [Planctomycetota bacterium]
MDEQPNRRAHFRLPYPPGAGPVLELGGARFEVTELSEGGLRLAPAADSPAHGARVSGVLHFDAGVEQRIEGTVKVADGVVLILTRGVELSRMLTEQRRILRAFPDFLRTEG